MPISRIALGVGGVSMLDDPDDVAGLIAHDTPVSVASSTTGSTGGNRVVPGGVCVGELGESGR